MASRRERAALAGAVVAIAAAIALLVTLRPPPRPRSPIEFVLLVSLDGLSSAVIERLGPAELPVLYGLAARGAFTWNARADRDTTATIPNHLSMITGLPASAHRYLDNSLDGRQPERIAASSVFDVLAEHRLSAALVSSKAKLVLYGERWRASLARVDAADREDRATVEAWDAIRREVHPTLTLLHLAGPDRAGHGYGWDSGQYVQAVRAAERALGEVLAIAEADPRMAGRTAVIVTSDHGGEGGDHLAHAVPANFTVPLVVVAPGRAGRGELYALNAARRADPGRAWTSTSSPLPPITTADVANLALELLGLPPVPGSTANARRDMTL